MKYKILILVVLFGLVTELINAQTQSCFTSTWTSWSCSVTCGNGTFQRTRYCTTNTVTPCTNCWEMPGQSEQTEVLPCVRDPCPYCTWTNFTVSECSSTCNTGFRLRSRQCLTGSGQLCGTCDGSDVISEVCTDLPACPDACPANSHVQRNYTECGVTCQNRNGTGTCSVQTVGCVCNSGYFRNGINGPCVKECDCGCLDSNSVYHAVGERWNGSCTSYICNRGGIIQALGTICNISVIPPQTNGNWSDWQDPSPIVCSATCGNGTRPQYRTCFGTQGGGAYCSGSGVRLVNCATNITCPGNDTWGSWSGFSACSVTCGNGTRTAYRNCTPSANAALGGSSACSNESSVNVTSCYAGPCPIDGAWTPFSSYSTCSAICSNGLQASYRDCRNQTSGGLTCTGYSLQFQNCSGFNDSYQCNAIGYWSNWTSLSACSVSCGLGYQYQTRQCLGAGFGCVGEAIITTVCNTNTSCPVDGNWTAWTDWSACPATCGTATIYRTRNCTGASNGGVCYGSSVDTRLCDTNVSCSSFAEEPINGGYTDWSNWTTCSSTCGEGTQVRTRSCTNPAPENGGNYCSGSPIEARSCNSSQPCPINGNWIAWSGWSDCSGTCGSGSRSRTRLCSNPPPTNGGQQCEGLAVEVENCSTNIECPVDGVWGNWSLTVSCFGICGTGVEIYTRNCTQPIAGGLICAGPSRQERACNLSRPCPINGGWGNWSSFTTCSVTCGVGVYSRIRECNNPPPLYGGDLCVGPALETAYCLTNVSCPINGGWTSWSSWTNCSLNCSGGIQTRTRNCSNPTPANNGAPCIGSNYQYQTCNDDVPCVILITGNPVNGTWGNWTSWGPCSGTCGNGSQTRYRNCSGQYNGGVPCIGASIEYQTCATGVTCPIDGGWSNYTSFGPCSATCGNGTHVRTRNCNNPYPQYGGAQCVGDSKQVATCVSNVTCPIDGGWSTWTESLCSSTCGIGYRVRQRNCSNPAPQFGGTFCIGSAIDTILCNVSNVTCPIMGTWGEWVNAINCSASCGYGFRVRNRTCLPLGTNNCVGSSVLVETCDSGLTCATPAPWNSTNGNWSNWSDWSSCSVSCANGTQYRTRACNNTTPVQGGSACRGDPLETRNCETNVACPVNGNWSEWSSYSPCSTTCGPGVRTRIRSCNNTNNFNELCIGPALETTVCNANNTCPIAGVWQNWSNWSTCSGSCGTGIQVRTRYCNVTAGGEQCSGPTIESQLCNTTIRCPVDGGWSDWGDWTDCSSGTCNTGTQYRYRVCDNPLPSNGGQLCPGSTMETKLCNGTNVCPIDGNWAAWSDWTTCSSTCAGGRRFRYRNCTNPAPSNGGISCIGASVDVDGSCGNTTCGANPLLPVGNWSDWLPWSTCAATCGLGIRRRVRTCNTTGLPCVGSNFELETCNSSIPCPVDGVWSDWSNYTACTASCGQGIRTRTRLCVNQAYGGQSCFGSATQTESCSSNISCPIDGQWTTWSTASPCSTTCGTGFTVRTRSCTQMVPSFGGANCPGSPFLYETCSSPQNCSVNGSWSAWAPWSSCTATCGKTARKYTTRTCSNPAPLYGGYGCEGIGVNITNCTELPDCPVCPSNQVYVNSTSPICPTLCSDPSSTNWCGSTAACQCRSPYAWSAAKNACVLWCDCGCYGKNNVKHALNSVWQEDGCNTYQCIASNNSADPNPLPVLISSNCSNCSYFSWSTWSTCSVPCGQGSRTRNRSCLYLNTNTPCSRCSGDSAQTQICQQSACEVCQLGPFVPATECSKTCGNGTQTMNRTCLNIADTSSSVPTTCSNPSTCGTYNSSVRNCNPDVCIICTWSVWANSRCSATCGTGVYTRQRFCQDQFSNNCTNCTPNSDTIGTRPCFYPSCTGRRRRSVMEWFTSWFDD